MLDHAWSRMEEKMQSRHSKEEEEVSVRRGEGTGAEEIEVMRCVVVLVEEVV